MNNWEEQFDQEFDYECLYDKPWAGESLSNRIKTFICNQIDNVREEEQDKIKEIGDDLCKKVSDKYGEDPAVLLYYEAIDDLINALTTLRETYEK